MNDTKSMRYKQLVMFNYWGNDRWKHVRYIGAAPEYGEHWHFVQHSENGEVFPVTGALIRPMTNEEEGKDERPE